MNKNCDIVMDLLPLYTEDICSQASGDFVRKHLAQCPECQAYLADIQKPTPVLPDTNGGALRSVRREIRKRMIFSVIAAIMLLLTVLAGAFVYATVPVWLAVDEAVVYAEQQADGSVKVMLSDKVCHISSWGDNRFCCQGMRMDWLLKAVRKNLLNQGAFLATRGEHSIILKPTSEEGLWYCGQYVGQADTRLWGEGTASIENRYFEQMDRSLLHIFCISAFAAVIFLICGILLRKKLLGKWLLAIAALLICCALTTVFVTGGHLYDIEIRTVAMLKFSTLAKRYVAIGIMTIISFITALFTGLTVYEYRKS